MPVASIVAVATPSPVGAYACNRAVAVPAGAVAVTDRRAQVLAVCEMPVLAFSVTVVPVDDIHIMMTPVLPVMLERT